MDVRIVFQIYALKFRMDCLDLGRMGVQLTLFPTKALVHSFSECILAV